jgi:hypothetical protein
MKRRFLFAYQLVTGLSDSSTGVLLVLAPALTLRLMRVHAVPAALPFLSYVGVFVLSVGVACLYGAYLVVQRERREKLETVWLLTAITRGLVALFVIGKVAGGSLESGWMTVACTDGLFAIVQATGLVRGWLRDV